MSEFSTLIDSYLPSDFKNKILIGTVVNLDSAYAYIDVGAISKSVGLVARREFEDEKGQLTIAKGDSVEVVMIALDTGYGDAQLSAEQAVVINKLRELEIAYKEGTIVEGNITGRVKGGFTVAFGPVTAFLPGSLVDMHQAKDLSALEGKQKVKIVRFVANRNNIVVSRKAALDPSHAKHTEDFLSTLQEGKVVKGIVKNITDYGVFVDIGGVDGLLHITDMAWKRIKHASELVSVGQEIQVKVLKYDPEKKRISLGMKQLGEDPWSTVAATYSVGTRLSGKVTSITDYGAFVEIGPSVEGLVHVTEMDWTNKNVHPSKMVALGEEVDVMILEIDQDKRRVSLGIKQCHSNPWSDFYNQYKPGDKVRGAIKSITDFGVFVGLPGNIDGLIHNSDLVEAGEATPRQHKKGDEIEAVILSIDPERERISLGVKQMNDDFSKMPAPKEFHEDKKPARKVKESVAAPTQTAFGAALLSSLKKSDE